MDVEVIRSLNRAVPFRPYTVNMTSRWSGVVSRPDQLVPTASGHAAWYTDERGLGSMLSLDHIVSIEVSAPPAADEPVIRDAGGAG